MYCNHQTDHVHTVIYPSLYSSLPIIGERWAIWIAGQILSFLKIFVVLINNHLFDIFVFYIHLDIFSIANEQNHAQKCRSIY